MWKTIRPEERFFRVSVDNCFREVHCFDCKYPSDTDQNFTDEGKHPAKTRYTLEKFPKNTEITRLMTFSHILREQQNTMQKSTKTT